jgi:hypothetical protein
MRDVVPDDVVRDHIPLAAVQGETAASRGVPLRVVELSHPDAPAAYGAAMALIRPDHYVAWRGTGGPADPAAVIDRIRGRGDRNTVTLDRRATAGVGARAEMT